MPVVNPAKPTLCLVGAPNVGKSSLVRVLSTGKPEVCVNFQNDLERQNKIAFSTLKFWIKFAVISREYL